MNNITKEVSEIINQLKSLDIYLDKLIISNKDVIDINIFDYIKITDNSIDKFIENKKEIYTLLTLDDEVNIMNYIYSLLEKEYKDKTFLEIIDRLHKLIINDYIDGKSFKDEINIQNILQQYEYDEISHDLLILQSKICKYMSNLLD